MLYIYNIHTHIYINLGTKSRLFHIYFQTYQIITIIIIIESPISHVHRGTSSMDIAYDVYKIFNIKSLKCVFKSILEKFLL